MLFCVITRTVSGTPRLGLSHAKVLSYVTCSAGDGVTVRQRIRNSKSPNWLNRSRPASDLRSRTAPLPPRMG